MQPRASSVLSSVLVAAVALGVAAPAYADVTVRASAGGGALGVTSTSETTTYIKGNKMRTDTIVGRDTYTTIFDVDEQRLYTFDSKTKEAEAWDMRAFAASLAASVDTTGMTATVKPSGKTKQIAGRTAHGYDMEITLPAAPPDDAEQGPRIGVKLSGSIWIVKDAPGAADHASFYKAAAAKGFIFSDPAGARSQPGHARALAKMYEELAGIGGIAYETSTTIELSGEGPLAGMMARMGAVTATSTVTAVDTARLPAALFAPPASYTIKEQRTTGVGR